MSTDHKNKKSLISCSLDECEFPVPSDSSLSFDLEWTDETSGFYESAFLHDLLNSAGGLRGYLELLEEVDDLVSMKKYVRNSLILCD